MSISKEQIKKAFVSDPKDIGEEAYNNQDWYEQDAQRMRYILATINMSPGDSYADFEGNPRQLKSGQEDNRFFDCIDFDYQGGYEIKDEKRLLELINMSDSEVADYVYNNEYDWIGDDYDHISQYLFKIMNYWQDVVEYDTEDLENMDCMTVTTRVRKWFQDGNYKSENKYEVAYNILIDYVDNLPDDVHKRLNKIGL
jgi:hypothetical protein